MAITKTTVASAQTIVSPDKTTVNYSFSAEAVVVGDQLMEGNRVHRPGVFTAGTPVENVKNNPQP